LVAAKGEVWEEAREMEEVVVWVVEVGEDEG
jgi:hypothetical protein